MKFIKYTNRFLALAWLFGIVMMLTSKIGNEASAAVITWGDSWGAIALLAAAMFLGFNAGRESKEQ